MQEERPERIKRSKLRRLNTVLSVIVVALSLYIVALPLVPNVTYEINKLTNIKPSLVRANTPGEPSKPVEEFPSENTLVIPSINLQKTIFDGDSIRTLEQGVWRRPATSDPTRGSNTVLVGHRYGYNGNGVFYHLDKVNKGDNIVLYWQGKKRTYTVTTVKVVEPDDAQVEAPTKSPILTLYTCTPMWSFTNRLVIVAEEMGAI